MAIQAGVSNSVTQTAAPLTWSLGGMRFDAWLLLNHNTSLTITQHPVETGAAITDHSYVNPRRYSFDIGMTDVALATVGDATAEAGSRSINAYNALVQMQQSRELLALVCKYGTFYNNLIVDISANDNFQTKYGSRFTVTVQEVILVKNQITKVSLRPQATDSTQRGQIPPRSTTQAATNFVDGLFR